MTIYYDRAGIVVHHGDCIEVLSTLPDASVDSVCCDPPYGLEFMGKEWDSFKQAPTGGAGIADVSLPGTGFTKLPNYKGTPNPTCRNCKGMKRGQDRPGFTRCRCDAPDFPNVALKQNQAFGDWCLEWATECLRVLKPGGHMLAFGGTRTSHRLACAVEDAGFEIRDSIAWLYGSGFPKSLRVSRDERYCHCDASVHTSSRTSPELVTDDHTRTADTSAAAEGVARSAIRGTNAPPGSPADCRPVLGSGDALPRLAGENAPASPQPQECAPARIRSGEPADGQDAEPSRTPSLAPRSDHLSSQGYDLPSHSPTDERKRTRASTSPADTSGSADHTPGRPLDSSPAYGIGFPVCTRCGKPNVDGLGTALKPAFEPIVVARKPLAGTVAANVLAHGVGALNVDGCRVGDTVETWPASRSFASGISPGYTDCIEKGATQATGPAPAGRWPANVVLDESQAAALDAQSGELTSGANPTRRGSDKFRDAYGDFTGQEECDPARGADSGGASRFMYVAKAAADERVRVNGTAHPTVKPLALMRWLVRLVTPPGGTCLEPFAGSGTTVEACILEGFACIAIEREADYLPLIRQRIHRRRDPVEAVRGSGEDAGLFDLLGGEGA